MYIYLHSVSFHGGRYAALWNQIDIRLNSLGMHGRKYRISDIDHNIFPIVAEEVKKGAHTVVAVGDDQLFIRLVEAAAAFENLTAAYLPLESTYLSKILGIPPQDLACDVLSARIVEKFNLLCVNKNNYIFRPLELKMDDLKLADEEINWVLKSFEPDYQLVIGVDWRLWKSLYADVFKQMSVDLNPEKVNVLLFKNDGKSWFGREAEFDWSFFQAKKFYLKRNDGEALTLTPACVTKLAELKVSTHPVKVVVGKNRMF